MEAAVSLKIYRFSEDREVEKLKDILWGDFCWLELVEEEPVGSRWEGSQQVWIEGVEGNLLSFSFVLSMHQYRLSLEGVCADIRLRWLPDHSRQLNVSLS